MVAAYRDSVAYLTSGSSITVDPASPALTYSSGDILLVIVTGYTSLGAPSGSDLTWTQVHTDTQAGGPFGNTDIMTVWWAVADAAITSFTIAHGVSDQIGAVLKSISGADTTSPIDAQAITSLIVTGSSEDPTCPSISPTGTDSLLVSSVGLWRAGENANTWTPPSGMTEREDFESWDTYSVATLGLSASGATGTKAFLSSPDTGSGEAWIASSIAIKSAGGTAHTATVTDTVGLTDSITCVLTATVTQTDVVGLTDSHTLAAEYTRTATDTVGLVDTGTADINGYENIGLTDTISFTITAVRTQTDPVGLTDTIVTVQTHALTVTDTLGLLDSITYAPGETLILTNAVGLSDSILVVTTQGFTFTSPTRPGIDYYPFNTPLDRIMGFVPIGITIWKDSLGVFHEERDGYVEDVMIAQATIVYRGGREHAITSQEADDLIAAGYGDYVEQS